MIKAFMVEDPANPMVLKARTTIKTSHLLLNMIAPSVLAWCGQEKPHFFIFALTMLKIQGFCAKMPLSWTRSANS
jgi:hypothetical protein